MKLIPVIICGGAGSRLWPISRTCHPKPFMPLPEGGNLIQKTFQRAAKLEGVGEILTVTNRELFFKTDDEYRQAGFPQCRSNFVLEPFGRNTAAAIAAAALDLASREEPDTILLVLPADHLIRQEEQFAAAVANAVKLAAHGWLVTFGIKPEYPETGFGYIELDPSAKLASGFKVNRFVEKPDLPTAQDYLESGNYLWNSGMFCFRLGTLLDELQQHAPDVLQSVSASLTGKVMSDEKGQHCTNIDPDRFNLVPDISIDYALMERSNKVATVPCDIGWSDIGSWNAFSELTKADESGNRCNGEVLHHGSKNNFIHSQDRLTALVGVEDLIVVNTPDALLVAHKDNAQDVKHIVGQLKSLNHDAHATHRTVSRPWGTYTTLEEGHRFKIKRIVVKPGASLSLQMHHHRSEHWVIVTGMAKVINGDQELMLNNNESTFIPAGNKHRLENPGVIDLVIIEVQCGDYLGEDDIVRFQDIYGRAGQ
ncbi:mannose-1-phosphate guanylyltransferase/mannose-6-phosphate isomerase [Pseudomonas sp. JS3066]|uniref:mannose-1-phosphate guanylyltransferase/mannose-6-phosphate isomerase n=1 Tax=Pseudomonas sp. JS3066 TaxID=3090665 RepID=UPI002E7B9571|nr:mannose-1-phosphate guanylyltransferase/mannose-6-phosphate isomerase [Pseudomonas sp. JS3066]WVK92830.1 mannose-1-phosphate guanylyltransferase/mannose-6-phosphate isomerase [Pseudomonas sp. JS3066]